MLYLIKNIWHNKSIISEINDPYKLVMPRFNYSEPWSPWNCILLTQDKADLHQQLNKGQSYYSTALFKNIHNAHKTAKLHFRLSSCFYISKIFENYFE